MSKDLHDDPIDEDPNSKRERKMDINMYGHRTFYENLVIFNCDEINQIAKEPFFKDSSKINEILGEEINFDDDILGLVSTDEAKIRIAVVLFAAKTHIFILITGPTSSAKTYSINVAYKIFHQKQLKEGKEIKCLFLRINLSEETSRDDLIGSIIFDEKENRFKFKPGPFTEAFEKGYWLLIDELSLAPPSVLQAIEAALDSRRLTVQMIGETKEIEMHKDFFLACTTNPNNKDYSRYILPINFLDRFLCIKFNDLSNEEMKKILFKKCNGTVSEDNIEKITDAHYLYTNNSSSKCKNMFTLRDLDKARFLFKQGYSADQIIDILYRTRAGEDLITYDSEGENLFSNFEGFIETDNRKKYFKLALDCLKNGYNIILENDHSEGTQYFASIIAKEFNKDSNPLIINLTDGLHVSDITEFSVPILSDSNMKIKMENGIIYEAMKTGRVVIINNLERGKTRVIESLNDVYECNLLDDKSIQIKRGFKVHPNFRIIFTFHSNVPHTLSAAFFNRFIHIKMKPTREISHSFNVEDNKPINIFNNSFPEIADASSDVEYLCKQKNIAHTSQIETFYALTKTSIEKNIPVCLSSETGYGLNLGIHLYLDEKFDSSKIHKIYCSKETSVEQLFGKYAFEGELIFQEGELLQAAIKGEVIIFYGIEKLSYNAFSCLAEVLDCLKDDTREFIYPGMCLSKYKISKDLYVLATINRNNNEHKDLRHISKYFHILPIESKDYCSYDYRKKSLKPSPEDYQKIGQLDQKLYEFYSGLIENLITCFMISNKKTNILDTSFRMFNRMLSSIRNICSFSSPKEEAICLFTLFQDIDDTMLTDLLTDLNEELHFDFTYVEELIKSNVKIQNNKLVKGLLSFQLNDIYMIDKINKMSTEHLNTFFYLLGINSPKILVGPTSFKETLIKKLEYNKKVKIFNATIDTSHNDIFGGVSFKKNDLHSGRFGHGEIFDLLIGYLQTTASLDDKIKDLNLHSDESFEEISLIIDEMDDGKLKPYYKYLFEIVKKESQYATFFDLGFLVKELLLGNTVLIKNVDLLNESIIDNLTPFLNGKINLKDCIPGDCSYLNEVQIPNPSIYFSCSQTKYNNLPTSFRSRVQAVKIKKLTKDDVKPCIDDLNLLNAYDLKVKDYSDIMRVIVIIKIASVLNKFKTLEEKIDIALKIMSQNQNVFNDKKFYELEELVEYDESTNELKSIRSGATIKVAVYNEKELKKFVYVRGLALLLDLTIISMATHIPLIVESLPGQAKSTFINCFACAIDKKGQSCNMSFSRSTEEFIGQITPKEDGFTYEKGILYKNLDEDKTFLIDEFNLASPSLLSLFLNVFKAPYNSNVVHPHEEGPFKKKFHLFATMNPANSTARRCDIPPGFYSCSIIYKMEDYAKKGISMITLQILQKEKYEKIFPDYYETINFIGKCHRLAMNQSNDVTIRDILKLEEIFQSSDFYDISINKKKRRDNKKKIASYVELVYSSKMNDCLVKFDNILQEYLGYDNMDKIPENVIKEQYRLKAQMKIALEKTNRGLIIEGPSGSGKTYCINDLANEGFDKKKHIVHTIQLCGESDISELLGRYEPYYSEKNEILINFQNELSMPSFNKELTINEKTALNQYLIDLKIPGNVDDTILRMKKNSTLMKIPKFAKKVNNFIKDWTRNISFDYTESLLVKAMKNGDWIVLENIHLCPGDILESLNSLLEENHILRLPNNDLLAMNCDDSNPESIPIHKNFRLIMTSDDQTMNASHIIPAPFLSRCIVLKIRKPSVRDLSFIGSNKFNIPYYTHFMSKCFIKDSRSHVRDIIRMANACKYLHQNGRLKIEEEIGKTIKFILNEDNYNIPVEYKNSKNDFDNIYRFIISIIQTNLIDYNLENDNFKPFTLVELEQIIQNLQESDLLSTFFKETLRLACFVFSIKPFTNCGENYTIQENIITLLLYGYMITTNPKNKVPDFIWDIKFTPAIWDFVFIAKNEYDKFICPEGFKQFIESHQNSEEFVCEFYNHFKINIKDFKEKTDEYIDDQINNLFERTSVEIKENPLLIPNKNEIEINKVPISFPSIPNNKLMTNDSISYHKAIELLYWFDIEPSINLLKVFNINLEEKSIFKQYEIIFTSSMDLEHSRIYDHLLEDYDYYYSIIKEVYDISDKKDNLLPLITEICKKYNIKIGDLINKNSEMQGFCNKNQNKCRLTELINKVLKKVENTIKYSYEQNRDDASHEKNRQKASNILRNINNQYFRDQIKLLMETYINEDRMNDIINLAEIDKHVSNSKHDLEQKYSNNKYLLPFSKKNNNKDIELSVILTKFIIPAKCDNFKITDNIYRELIKKMMFNDVQKFLSDIDKNLNKEKVNYTFLETLLDKMSFKPVSILDLNDKETISNMISKMNEYSIYSCIAFDPTQPKEYINEMINGKIFALIPKKYISHLDKSQKKKIRNQYNALTNKDDDDDDDDEDGEIEVKKITIDLLKEKCPAIPSQDFGKSTSLKCEEGYEGNSIAKLAHFLTSQEIQKMQIEKNKIIPFQKGNIDYQIIPIELLIINLIYVSKYENIENSLAKEFNLIDQIFDVLNPKYPQELLKKDIILYLSEKNKKYVEENEKAIIRENVDNLLSTNNIDINNISLSILYNEYYRKRKIKFIIAQNERKNIQNSIEKISNIINNKFIEIRESFKYIIRTRTRKEIEEKEGPRIFDDVYYLAQKFFNKLLIPGKKGYKLVQNGEYFIQESSGDSKFSTIFSEESLQFDPKLKSDEYNHIIKCRMDYFSYHKLEKLIKRFDMNQFQMSDMEYEKYVQNNIEDNQIKILYGQILTSIRNIQEIGNYYQTLEEPFHQKIIIDNSIEPPQNICDFLIIGNTSDGVRFLNEVDYDLGNCLPNSTISLNIFNIANAKIRTQPESKIDKEKDQLIISTKLYKENQIIQFLNDLDNTKIGEINFNCTFNPPKIYLMFSIPIKIEGNCISIKGEVGKDLTFCICSDTSSMNYIVKLDEIESDFSENLIDKIVNNDKISFSFKRSGYYKGQLSITFPVISITISSMLNITVKNKKHTFMYKLDDFDNINECDQKTIMGIPSFIAIKTPQILQWSKDIEMETKISNNEYLHLAYIKKNSDITTINNFVDFAFQPVHFQIKKGNKFAPKLSKFIFNFKKEGFGYFTYFDGNISFTQYNKCESIVKLYYDHGKLKNLEFKVVMLSYFYKGANYNDKGIYYLKDDPYKNDLDTIIDQIQEKQNVHFDLSTDFIIPWINIIGLFDKTKEEQYESIKSHILNNNKLRNDESYYVEICNDKLKSIQRIPDEILFNKKIKSFSRRIIDIRTEKFDRLELINCNNLFDILQNLDDIKQGLQLYRQIYEYKKETALNIFKIYSVLKTLGENGIMLETFNDIISIGDKLFSNNDVKQCVEVINDKNIIKSNIIINFKDNNINDFYNLNVSTTGHKIQNIRSDDIRLKTRQYEPISVEKILESKEYQGFYEILKKKPIKSEPEPPPIIPKDERKDDIKYEIIDTSDVFAALVKSEPKETDESEYPENAYYRSISTKVELYSLTNIEKENDINFLPDDVELVDGEIPNLDKYVYNVLEKMTQSNFSLCIPNEHITFLVDISQLSGSQNKNELCVSMMVALQVVASFDIQFSVWMFADRKLCFCAKKPDDIFDHKRKCFIRDAYFLKRRNPDSYVLSALDTVTRLKVDQKSNMFIILSTFVSSQTLRPYEEWKQIALSCTCNKHMICMLEPCQHINNLIDRTLKNTVKESEFIHVIKYTDITESVTKLMVQIFNLSKNNSKGSKSLNIDSVNVPFHKFLNTTEFQDKHFYCFKNNETKKITPKKLEIKKLNSTEIKGNFEVIDLSILEDFGDISHIASLLLPNLATKYELSSHGYIIDIKGLIKSFLSNFTDLNIFKQKTGDKIRDYCVDIIIDCSYIVKMYSIDHCFISVISLILSLQELSIPYVNLVIIGKHIISLLSNANLKYISNYDPLFSRLYSILIEEASESRLFEEGLRQVLANSLDNLVSHIMFVVTDALFGKEHEENIKDILSFAKLNEIKIIGIGTGPVPYRIKDLFELSVYAKDPYMLREALDQLNHITIPKKRNFLFSDASGLPPIMQSDSNTNDNILEMFSKIELYNGELIRGINKESLNRENFSDNYVKESINDLGANNEYNGYKVLIMMFHEGMKETDDENINRLVLEKGLKDRPDIPSVVFKLLEKGFGVKIVTTYLDALNELCSGEYSIAMLATCSDGYEGKKNNDSDFLEPFLIAITKFFKAGGGLMIFGENPPFIYEANLIFKRIGVNIMFDENEFEEGGKIMTASSSKNKNIGSGQFLGPEYTFDATINGSYTKKNPSIGAGILKLIEGKTLAVFKTTDGSKIEDSFEVFSRSSTGKPTCIYKIPLGKEGVLFIDNGASKLFNEYNEEGASRYIINLSIGCIHFSHFRESFQNDLGKETIKIVMTDEEMAPKPTIMKRRKPLLISLLIDATDSMQQYIEDTKNNLKAFFDECKSKIEQLEIYFQIVAYRDFDMGDKIVEFYEITHSLEVAIDNLDKIKAVGGVDLPENISIGFETALKQVEEFKKIHPDCNNIFILIADSPNHDKSLVYHDSESNNDFLYSDNSNLEYDWKGIWLHIDEEIKRIGINKLICIPIGKNSDEFIKFQYDIWNSYGCKNMEKIMKKYELKNNNFHNVFVNDVSNEVKFMYRSSFVGHMT